MSVTGMPSVMQMISSMPASTASRIESAANGGGTKISEQFDAVIAVNLRAPIVPNRPAMLTAFGTSSSNATLPTALRVAQVCDEILDEAVAAYEKLAGMASTGDDEWRRQANALWHAAREYRRRPASAAPAAGIKSGSLQKLALEYDLEASALLALKLALGGFRQICPDCELESRPQTFVA